MRQINIHTIKIATLKNVLTVVSGKPKIITKIAKEVDMTYSFILNLIMLLEKLGYVTTEKLGRIRICSLTQKGKYLVIELQKTDSKCPNHIYTLVKILGCMDTEPKTGRTILRETGIGENVVYNLIKELERNGLITTFKSGRTKNCTITNQGKALYEQIKDM